MAKTKKYSAPKLAKIFSCNKKTIFKALEDNGVFLPNLGQFSKRCTCNEEFFDRLNPISSYWLGFIAADGYLFDRYKSLTIGLAIKDENHIQKFKKAIKADYKISYILNSVRISIYSKRIFDRLNELGVSSKKSLTINNVRIPTVLESHFIRGVFDGDGWAGGRDASHLQFAIAGNRPFLTQIQNILIKNCAVNKVNIYSLSGETEACRVQYTGFQIFRILGFLYRDSTTKSRLTRKYKRYLALKNKFG